jgi:hypothetical protein
MKKNTIVLTPTPTTVVVVLADGRFAVLTRNR